MHFSKEKKKPELKSSKCDLIEMMKVAYKDECTIGSLAEFSWMWFSDKIAGTAGDGVVIEGSVWEAFGDETEMASRAEPEW